MLVQSREVGSIGHKWIIAEMGQYGGNNLVRRELFTPRGKFNLGRMGLQ